MSAFQPTSSSVFFHLESPTILDMIENIGMEHPMLPYDGESTGTILLAECSLAIGTLDEMIRKFSSVVLIQDQNTYSVDDLLDSGVRFVLRPDFTLRELIHILKMLLNEHKHRIENTMLQNIFSKAQNSIVITDLKGSILYANDYFERLTGYNFLELIGASARMIKSGSHDEEFYNDLWTTIQAGQVWEGVFINRRKDGSLFYEESTITPVVGDGGQIVSYLKIGRSVERERLHMTQLGDEVRLAKDIVISMLPAPFDDGRITFESKIRAYNYLGGDFISFQQTGKDTYRVALVDVMGHGASSTMIGLKLITMFQDFSQFYDLARTVNEVNGMIVNFNRDDSITSKYVSGVFFEIDLMAGTIDYINAGHPDIKGMKKDGSVGTLPSNNLLLGVNRHFQYSGEMYPVDDYRGLFLYTDGLIENDVSKYVQVDDELEETLQKEDIHSPFFLQRIVDHMIGNAELKDDIALCLLLFKDSHL